MPDCLGKVGAITAAIMPERIAKADASIPVKEMVGSGPFRFVPRNTWPGRASSMPSSTATSPRSEPASLLAGGKIVNFDRVEWQNHSRLRHRGSGAAAGRDRLARTAHRGPAADAEEGPEAEGRSAGPDRRGRRHPLQPAYPPFNNPVIRRIILGAVTQSEFMRAVVGDDTTLWRDKVGFFPPGSPMANDEGMEALTGKRDLAASAQALKAAGYNGEPVTMMAPTDFPSINAMSEVTNELLGKLGMKVNYIATDWGSALRRMANRDTPDKGGYNLFCTYSAGITQYNRRRTTSSAARATRRRSAGRSAPGSRSCATSGSTRRTMRPRLQIGRAMQKQAFIDVPYVPLGVF